MRFAGEGVGRRISWGWGRSLRRCASRATLSATVAAFFLAIAPADFASAEGGSAAVSFGGNGAYELGVGFNSFPGETTPLAVLGLSNITSLASGYRFTLALLADGTVRSWGGPNVRGELGNSEHLLEGEEENEESGANEIANGQFSTVKGLEHVTAVADDGTHALALREGKVLAWGDDEYGELGTGELNPRKIINSKGEAEWTMQGTGSAEPVPVKVRNEKGELVPLEGVTAIGAGGMTDFAARRVGSGEEVLAWGANTHDELGMGEDGAGAKPQACKNEFAQYGKTLACSTEPRKVQGLPSSLENGETHVVKIAGAYDYTLVLLSDGAVWSWGENANGQLGTEAVKRKGSAVETRSPKAVKVAIEGVQAISTHLAHALAIVNGASTGELWGWGTDGMNQLATAPTAKCQNNETVPCKPLPGPAAGFNAPGRRFTSIAAGSGFSLAATSTGELFSVGRNEHGELGRGRTLGWLNKPPKTKEGETAAEKAAREKLEAEEKAEIAEEEAEDQTVAVVPGVDAAAVDAGNEFGIALLQPGEPAPAPNLTITPLRRKLEVSWSFPTEEAILRWITYEPCSRNMPSYCPRKTLGREVGPLAAEVHSHTFGAPPEASLEEIQPHRVIIRSGQRSLARRRYLWGTPFGVSVTRVSPSTGPIKGGMEVTITGTEFTAATAVKFGSTSATSFTVNSASSITAVVPPHAGGVVDVTVVTPEETSPANAADRLTYVPVLITGLGPSGGSALGTNTVTVHGGGFVTGSGGTKFEFGSLPALEVNCASSTVCTMKAPPHEPATVDVRATQSEGTSAVTPEDRYTYTLP